MTSGLVILAAVVALGWWFRARRRSAKASFFRKERMPRELAMGRLLLSEEQLFCAAPVPMSGRPDQVYRTTKGVLVLVDTKTRSRPTVYDKDRMQLAAYKVVIENCGRPDVGGRAVRDHGYIRFVCDRNVSYVRMRLAGTQAVVDLYHRYLSVTRGEVVPTARSRDSMACRRCDYREVCPRQ